MKLSQKKSFFSRISFGLAVTNLVLIAIALLRFAQPYAVQTSRLRQLDSFLIPILTCVCGIVIFSLLIISFFKKTNGDYAPFGFIIWGLALILYGVITPDRVLKVLYASPLQKFVKGSGLHIDVTTIQSVKTITEALNLVACSAAIILGAAAVLSLIRRVPVNYGEENKFLIVFAAALGLLGGCTFLGFLVKVQGYSFLFAVLGVCTMCCGLLLHFGFRKNNVS